MSILQLTVRPMTGPSLRIQVPNTATGLDVKKALHQQDSSLEPHLLRLVAPGKVKLSDDSKLSAHGVGNGTTLSLVILGPCNIHVQAVDGRMHTVVVPSSEPEVYKVRDLFKLVEKALGRSVDEFQFHHQGRVVEETRHGRERTLGDCCIKSDSTLVITRMGLVLNVTNPKVDVCFLVDCTGSMRNAIVAVKDNIQQLQQSLVAEYSKCDLRFAFVRYTDYDMPRASRTTYLDFTTVPSIFRSFVSAITPEGGGNDGPEDVMGGLKVALCSLSWRSEACKILIHIGDCPCHGNRYHNFTTDFYPIGDPAGITHESMMEKVVELEIQYWFGFVDRTYTDKMIGIFNDTLRALSKQRLIIRQFDAMQPSQVGEAVQKSVIASVYGSAALKAAAVQDFKLDLKVPDWNTPSIIQQSANKTPPPRVMRLFDLQEKELILEKPSVNFAFKIAPNPFAEGSECLVYHGSDLVNFRRVVMKRYKRSGKEHNTLNCYMRELEVRIIAAVYAREFNADKPPNTSCLEFTPLDIVQCNGGGMIYMLERFLAGNIEKFNNNCGIVVKRSPHSDLLQAFSHYTWVKSGMTLLVCDLQGFKEDARNCIVLTDPAIHSRGSVGNYGAMDGGMGGVQAFFNTHTCSGVCAQMNLVGKSI